MIQYINGVRERDVGRWVEPDPLVGKICRRTIPRRTTMIGIPFFLACIMRRPASGWASNALEPHMTMRSEFRTSSNGLVAAPDPNESESPATDGPWQIRAQLSTLLVRNPTRANFCIA